MNRDEILAAAIKLHDEEGCGCDPRYIISCPHLANCILKIGVKAVSAKTDDVPGGA